MQLSIEVYLDDGVARITQAALEVKNEQIKNAIEENQKKTKETFAQAMAAMRAGYMVISGITQAMGGTMSQAFSAMYGIAMAGIQTGLSISAALAASGPAGWIQAAMMSASLIAAIVQLGAVAIGQEDFAQQISGLNMTIQGLGSLMDSMNFS